MRNDNIRKYIFPNIPYLFILWACLKVGTVYRLAAGGNMGQKLVGMMATLAPALADFAPGLNPFDWLVGIAGAAGIRLVIYCKAKKAKKAYLDTYTSTHSYDEYHFDLDEIEHDPYVLTSILSALHEGEWTLAQVEGTLQTLFDRQYILTENVVREVRYRTETRTAPDGGSYTVRVPYNYYICTVTLENFNLSHLPIHIMGEGQLSRYALFMATLGNRPDLFPGSSYIGKYVTNGPTLHDVPEAYLSDPTFAALLTEAEKYIGYPYVWGGHSPSTSFSG